MGTVHLDAVEPRFLRAQCRRNEIVAQLLDLVAGQGARSGRRIVGRCDGLRVDQRGGRAHAGVVQLYEGKAALCLDCGRQPRQPFEVRVGEDTELARKALSL